MTSVNLPSQKNRPLSRGPQRELSVEVELQDGVKAAGGKWNAQEQAWKLPYGEILELGLTDYMME